MSHADLIADLVLLTRAAADAGEDWRGRLRRDFLPSLARNNSHAELLSSLSEWEGASVKPGGSLEDAIESAVTAALLDHGHL